LDYFSKMGKSLPHIGTRHAIILFRMSLKEKKNSTAQQTRAGLFLGGASSESRIEANQKRTAPKVAGQTRLGEGL